MTFVSCAVVSEEGLTNEARQFLRAYIHSIEQLEVLALLRGDPSRAWTTAAIYERILSNERSIAARLSQFEKEGIVTPAANQPAAYVYRADDLARDHAIDEILQAYKHRRVLVIETIFRPADEAAQSFANAFRFKKP